MALPKISLFDMAEAVGDIARTQRGHVDRWNRDHPEAPFADDDPWVTRARTFETAHLTLSVMALDEDASRKFVGALMQTPEGKQLVSLLAMPEPKAKASEAA